MKKRYNTNTLTIAYLSRGVEALEDAIQTARTTYQTVRKVVNLLTAQGATEHAKIVEDWLSSRGKAVAVRGRSVPNAGQKRMYKVQKTNNGNLWIRLPVDVLAQDDRLNYVQVSYDDKKIVVRVTAKSAQETEEVVTPEVVTQEVTKNPNVRLRRN